MNTCSFVHCYFIIIAALEVAAFRYFGEKDLYEGSPCKTEHGESGFCKQIRECPARIEEIRQGRRFGNSLGRCGFNGTMEIVCCANKINNKFNVRPADSACQANRAEKVTPLIWYGLVAAEAEFPYMVALGYNNTDGEVEGPIAYNCGGSLISSKYILTAAHCLRNINNYVPRWARLGSVDTNSPENAIMIPVDSWIVHPEYKRSQEYNDIGLVLLKNPVNFSNTIKPVCLQTVPLEESSINSNTSFTAIGFGYTENDVRSNKLLKTANLDLVATEKCNASFADRGRLWKGIDDTLICARHIAATRISDTCGGDSGGPLVMVNGKHHTVVGVTSFGRLCSSVVPGVYTAVNSYIDWIESIVWPENTRS